MMTRGVLALVCSLVGSVVAFAAEPEGTATFHVAPAPLAADAVTSDWPGLLGVHRDGISVETRLRKDLEENPPTLVWEYPSGDGYAPPAVADGKLVFTFREKNEIHVDCLDPETGERFWRRSHACEYVGPYIRDGGPRSSPVIAGDRVFVHSVEGLLRCFDLETGRVVWERDTDKEFKIGEPFFGRVATPVVYGDLLIQNIGATEVEGSGSVMAFDIETGETVWSSGREWGGSCASPVIAKLHGEDRVFVLTGGRSRPATGGLMVLVPETGEVLLEHPFRSRTYESVNGACPLVGEDGDVYLTAAYNTGTVRVDVADDGSFEQAWRNRRNGVEFSTPLLIDGFLYCVIGAHDRAGAVVVIDTETGEVRSREDLYWDARVYHNDQWKELPLSIGAGSMIYADGDGLLLGDNGDLLWVKLDPAGVEVISRVSLFRANESWTPPVVSNGLLYVRQNKRERFGEQRAMPRLLCYDLRERD